MFTSGTPVRNAVTRSIRAAELGADVTVVDLSETMLRKFAEAQGKEAPHLNIRRIHSDIMKVDEFEQYDMVVANFFLNVFDEDMMVRVLEHLIDPSGQSRRQGGCG